MDASLAASLLLALTGTAAIGSIVLVTALLATRGGRARALGYLLGNVGAYAVIGMAVVGADVDVRGWTGGEAGRAGPITLVVLGAVLLFIGARTALRKSAPGGQLFEGRRGTFLDRVTPLRAVALGATVAVVNVKNLALFLTSVAALQASGLNAAGKLSAAPVLALAFCLAPFLPLAIDVAAPDRSERVRTRLRMGLQRYGRGLGTWVPLVVGIVFVVRGVRVLA